MSLSQEMEAIQKEWDELDTEFSSLEDLHRDYDKKVTEVKAMQAKCLTGIAHQRYTMKQLNESIKNSSQNASEEEKKKFEDLSVKMIQRNITFRDMEDILPHQNGLYLRVILGSVNVSLLSKHDKFNYKENYEMFKLYVTMVAISMATLLMFIPASRTFDAAFQFVLVWYYCTLTIREHILKVNGSRIKGWWVTHHFISTACSGVLLIWPDGYTYNQFRNQFVVFSLYISVVQVAQYYYQKGCLYRLRALGERHNMDLTVEGFQSWMWRGLTFLLPFLITGYLFQLYNSYVLLRLSFHPKCIEMEVFMLSILFFIIFLGNFLTMYAVVQSKLSKVNWMQNFEYLRTKYRFTTATVPTPEDKDL